MPNLIQYKFGMFVVCFFISNIIKADTVNFHFFTEDITIRYQPNLFDGIMDGISAKSISSFYNTTEPTLYAESVQDLLAYKQKLHLNDWLYYLLVLETAKTIYATQDPQYQTLFCWLLLSEAGYKAQLNFHPEQLLLSVFTMNKVYDVPLKKHGWGWMAELTSLHNSHKITFSEDLPSFYLPKNKKAFSFDMTELPVLSNTEKERKVLQFQHDHKIYRLNFFLDKTMMQILATYPELSIKNHLNMPLSHTTYNSVIPALQNLLKGKSDQEAIRFLLSFTRTAFEYQDDKIYKHDNVTFFPEETLFYPYSDCEDRSILFAYLTKELLDIKTILLDYTDHVAVGIKLEEVIGVGIRYDNETYVFCEPTDPKNTLDVGEFPHQLQGRTYSVFK